MSAVLEVTKTGPKTFIPAERITGGQLVEARAAGRIGVAAAGSTKVLGVALTDAQNPEAEVTAPTTGPDGRPVLNTAQLPTRVTVAYSGTEVKVTYSAAATFGDKLVATAAGKVGPAAATPDARTIVGICTEPAGVAANGVGLMRIA
ncbi:hypothetical protein [Rhodococcus sp. A5(2022)]|uniref:hypothetical protein n=1 Tax=Rhodococcus sp. A5(2022) TaxID=3003588 RepID=UPI0022A84E5B|nr:hypothetical protein [Rhodococcus sp. A5(2022)]MCZ1075081.1 hypothetical protein [Rhodococcus sp. A5(2022)]